MDNKSIEDSIVKSEIESHSQTLNLRYANHQLKAELCLTFASLQELKSQKIKFLHPEEFDYWITLSFSKRQHSYLLGRYCAKQVMTRYDTNFIPTHVLIKSGVFDYPIAYYPSHKKIQLTLSHCELMGVALAFPEEVPMGIDLETIQSANKTIIETQLTIKEKQWITACNYTRFENLYTLFWTLKEALSKVLRTGMMTPFKFYAVKNVTFKKNYWISEFENFAQYQAVSFLLDQKICSIVYPKKTELFIDIDNIQRWVYHLNNKYKTVGKE